jgi:hypothetical protein
MACDAIQFIRTLDALKISLASPSHVVMLSHPEAVAKVIEAAAKPAH